jgi:PRTRC genetic system protein A
MAEKMTSIARYYVARPESPAPEAQEQGFDFIWAANGVFKRARNRYLEACIPVAARMFPGLLPILPYVRLLGERIPGRVLSIALADARKQARARPAEAMYHVHLGEGRVRLSRPRQDAGAASLTYRGGGEADVVMDIHSHCQMRAFFSLTDDRDEQGFRLYAVMGHVFNSRPQIGVRVGVWGSFWPVPVWDVFSPANEWEDVYEHGSNGKTVSD